MDFSLFDTKAMSKQQEYYDKIKPVIVKELSNILTEEEKEDPKFGFVVLLAMLRVCANMAVKFGLGLDTFIFGCKHIFDYEQTYVAEHEANLNEGEEIDHTDASNLN